MDDTQEAQVKNVIDKAEERAVAVLGDLGPSLRKHAEKGMSLQESSIEIPAKIPGHATVSYSKPVIGEFAALVTDVRGSTQHLRQAIRAKFSQVERVYFETSLLLAAHCRIVDIFGGSTTEFLGDGLLALFEIKPDGEAKSNRAAFRAGWSCLEATQSLIGPRLAAYDLPHLRIGVGVARSRAIVSAVGDPETTLQPSAFGECVFKATKQSGYGEDEVWIDQSMRDLFKSKKPGSLRFGPVSERNGFASYQVSVDR